MGHERRRRRVVRGDAATKIAQHASQSKAAMIVCGLGRHRVIGPGMRRDRQRRSRRHGQSQVRLRDAFARRQRDDAHSALCIVQRALCATCGINREVSRDDRAGYRRTVLTIRVVENAGRIHSTHHRAARHVEIDVLRNDRDQDLALRISHVGGQTLLTFKRLSSVGDTR